MSDFISPLLVPPGISDQRDRDFIAALSAALSEFTPSALVIQDALTAPAALLPIMVAEAGLTEFVSPDMREELLRAMIDAAPEIHAMRGTVAGVRRALSTLNIAARWIQWFEQNPMGPHNTHKVVLFLNDTVIDGYAPLDLPNQRAAARVLAAAKRHSQDIAIQYGMGNRATLYAGAAARRSRNVRINALRLGNERFNASVFTACISRTLRIVRINAKAA